MKNSRTKRFRLLVVLIGFVLLAAACANDPAPQANDDGQENGATQTDDPPADDPQDGGATADDDGGDTVVEDPPVEDPPADEVVPDEPTGPVLLALTPDPVGTDDPLETINQLPGVLVARTETGVSFQFDQMNNGGLRVIIQDRTANVDVFCDMYDAGDGSLASTCSGYNPGTGEFLPAEDIPLLDVPEGYAFDVPLMVDENSVSVAFGGTTYSAPNVRIADEPGFVQIDPNTGMLSAPVVRDVGFATAGELFAALG
jgi:hypothetical protein